MAAAAATGAAKSLPLPPRPAVCVASLLEVGSVQFGLPPGIGVESLWARAARLPFLPSPSVPSSPAGLSLRDALRQRAVWRRRPTKTSNSLSRGLGPKRCDTVAIYRALHRCQALDIVFNRHKLVRRVNLGISFRLQVSN